MRGEGVIQNRLKGYPEGKLPELTMPVPNRSMINFKEKEMASKFKKGDTVKVTRGTFKAKGRYLGTTPMAQGNGGGVWHKVDVNGVERRYRECNLKAA